MMEPNKVLKLINLFKNDADSEHYVDRVQDTLHILETVLDVEEILK